MAWLVGASKGLPIDEDKDRAWDGPAALRRMVKADKARLGCLVYEDDADPKTQAAYKLPFADIVSGELRAITSGLRAAASRLPQTDIPEGVKDKSRKILDAYFDRLEEDRTMTPLYLRLWSSMKRLFQVEMNRDIAMQQIGGQIMSALDAQNNEQEDYNDWHFLQDLYIGDEGAIYTVTVSGGKLYRWNIEIDAVNGAVTMGQPVQVNPSFESSAAARTIKIERREDGRYAAFAILSTALLNKSGEIDTRSMFDSFVERFKGNGDEYINIYHLGRDATRIGELRTIFREDNLLIGYYVLDDNIVARKAGETLAADTDGYWGGSVEFLADDDGRLVEVAPDVHVKCYERGTLLGYSIAPAAHGAAWGTEHLKVRTMNEMNKKIVSDLVGGDQEALEQVEGWLNEANVRTKQPGAISRTVGTPEVEATQERAEDTPEGEDAGVSSDYEIDLDQIVAAIVETDWAVGLTTTAAQLTDRLDAVEEAVSIMQSQMGETATTDTPTQVEQIAAITEQVAGIEEELTRFRSRYDAALPAQPRVFEKSPKRKVVIRAKPTPESSEADETDEVEERVQPAKVVWKDHGLFQERASNRR